MSLATGTRLGAYEIVGALGAGGMGEVYRARDTRLDRDVAIKILPDLFATDPERLARFEREAKTLASLSHSHIAQIYGLEPLPSPRPEEHGGARSGLALVMELVDGEDLSARIARGAIPAADALPIALQIADALEAAHERGIIHRDLKPANIKVTADGAVKVLDFGLAKAIEGTNAEADQRNSPTMSIAGTRAGMVLGTASYMAPEQARGHAVDRRADVWAFGVVLFEMLSGKQAFSGDTISDVLASVLKNDLDWRALPAGTPGPILRLLRRCLDPDRRNRLRDIGEARVAIAAFLAGKGDAPDVRVVAPAPSRRALFAALGLAGALAIALAIVVAAVGFRSRMAPEVSKRFVVVPPEEVSAYVSNRPSIAIAPDGWTLAFAGLDKGALNLYLRGPAEFDPRKLPGTEGGSNPEFSPDGRSLAFFTTTQLKVMALDAGPGVIAPANDPRGLSWADETTIVYTPEAIGGIMEVSVKGAPPRVVTTIDEKAGERTHRWPHVLPGGRWVLFTVGTVGSPDSYDNARIDAVDRTTGERRVVFQGGSMPRYAPTGHMVFTRGGSLYAVKFDAAALKVSGTASSVLQAVGGDLTTGAAHVSWSAGGALAYVPGDARGGMRQLVWVDLKGEIKPVPLAPALYNDIRISPDGTRLAVAQGPSGTAEIFVYAFARNTYTRLTFTGVTATPVWSTDGREIFFSGIDASGRGTTVFRTSADGGREPVPIVSVEARVFLKHVSPDGTWALVDYLVFSGARANVGRLQLKQDAKVEPIVDTRADEYAGAVSPDGRFIAYQSDADGKPEVYVREITQATTGRWQISNAGGEEPMWSPDGRAIYYRIEGRLMMVPVDTRATFQPGLPAQLFDGVYNLRSDTGISYHPHPDGKRLLMARAADVVSGGSVRIVTRWFEELKKIQ